LVKVGNWRGRGEMKEGKAGKKEYMRGRVMGKKTQRVKREIQIVTEQKKKRHQEGAPKESYLRKLRRFR